MSEVRLEVCVDSVASAISACQGGAHRLELCSGLTDGGLTPSAGLIKRVCESVMMPVMVLIRPRPGDFLYDDDELEVMREDILTAKRCGASGVVLGMLASDGSVDEVALAGLMAAAQPGGDPELEVTFHRAIDLARDPVEAARTVASLGVERILTSGAAQTALEGAATIRQMVEATATTKTVVMAGGGVDEGNAAELVAKTGVQEVHGSLRAEVPSEMLFRRQDVFMGAAKTNGKDAEYVTKQASSERVETLVVRLAEVQKAIAAVAAEAAESERKSEGGKSARSKAGGDEDSDSPPELGDVSVTAPAAAPAAAPAGALAAAAASGLSFGAGRLSVATGQGSSEAPLAKGTVVILNGLNTARCNGQRATVMSDPNERGKQTVRLGSGERFGVRREQMSVVAEDEPEPALAKGTIVILTGLNTERYNGQRAMVRTGLNARGRQSVSLDTGERVGVLRKNMTLTDPTSDGSVDKGALAGLLGEVVD